MRMGIGSDFEFDVSCYRNKSAGLDWFAQYLGFSTMLTDSGRTALRLGLRYVGLHPSDKLFVPAYICDSVLRAIRAEGITPVFYGLGPEFEPHLDCSVGKRSSAVLLVDIFGMKARNREMLSQHMASQGYRVVHDISHSILADVTRICTEHCVKIASIRKILPIPDGGLILGTGDLGRLEHSVLNNAAPHAVSRTGAMLMKAISFANLWDVSLPFRERFLDSEAMLDSDLACYGISAVSRALLPYLDVESMAQARRLNYQHLLDRSSDWSVAVQPVFQTMEEGDVPLGFPVFCSCRDSLRQFLISRGIYPPIHWRLSPEIAALYPDSDDVSRRILTIPCDHRYDLKDMNYISDVIFEWSMTQWED